MTVASRTTPANYFHLLRRQALRRRTGRWWCSPRSRCCGCKAATSTVGGLHRRHVPAGARRPDAVDPAG